jgi:hypothetical protein
MGKSIVALNIQLYDSVMVESTEYSGNELQYREFILYESGQAYPEYVITYKRSAENARPHSNIQHMRRTCQNLLRNIFNIRPE